MYVHINDTYLYIYIVQIVIKMYSSLANLVAIFYKELTRVIAFYTKIKQITFTH